MPSSSSRGCVNAPANGSNIVSISVLSRCRVSARISRIAACFIAAAAAAAAADDRPRTDPLRLLPTAVILSARSPARSPPEYLLRPAHVSTQPGGIYLCGGRGQAPLARRSAESRQSAVRVPYLYSSRHRSTICSWARRRSLRSSVSRCRRGASGSSEATVGSIRTCSHAPACQCIRTCLRTL